MAIDWTEKWRHIEELIRSYQNEFSYTNSIIITENEIPELVEYIIQEFKGEIE